MRVDAVITGAGISEVGRYLTIDPWTLTTTAALAAVESAGLEPSDIDGVSTYPGGGDQEFATGLSGAGALDLIRLLGLRPRWYNGGAEMPSQLGAVFSAAAAVSAGLARHVLCFRSVSEASARRRDDVQQAPTRVTGEQQWTRPYGHSLASLGGLDTQRYFHETGGGREQLANVALLARRHAAANPLAVYREPLDLDGYLSARMVSDPLCLLDCDVPVDGCTAFVVSQARSAANATRPAIRVESIGGGGSMQLCAARMWEATNVAPPDIDVAQIYDGFSVFVPQWLEALGFCSPWGGLDYMGELGRVSLDGELPLNTGGGQLSGGRLHGFGHLHEACQQLWGACGARQLNSPELAVVTAGSHEFVGSMVLRATG